MAAVSPAGPEPMIRTLCRRGSLMETSVFQRAGLQSGLAILYIDTELHGFGPMTAEQRIPIFAERLLELRIGEAFDAFAALLLQADEFFVDRAPLRLLIAGADPSG